VDLSRHGTAPEPSATSNRTDLVRDAQAEHAEAERATRPWRVVVRGRVTWILVALVVWSAAVVARLAHIQIVQYDALVSYMDRQVADTEVMPGLRGRILDRNGTTLAVTVQGDVIAADPRLINEPGYKLPVEQVAARVCAAIAGCGVRDRDRMVEVLRTRTRKRYQVLWREASPADAQRVSALDLRGVMIERESRRFYPNRELAAHLVGHVDDKLRGLAGVEFSQDANIRGRDGKRLVFRDGRREGFDSVIEQPPTMGAGVELTIDSRLQLIVERELAAGVKEYGAKGGLVVVLDPWTGEILAAASSPTFNPNAFTEKTKSHQRNRIAQDVYEPGSTFKIVTASTGLDTHVVSPDTLVNVTGGTIRIGSHTISDTHYYGPVLSVRDVVVKSSNVGAIRIGLQLGAPRVSEYAKQFGFGWLAPRDLPHASRGAIRSPEDEWPTSVLASVSFGYQVGVTAIQMASAASAIANGGVLYEPHVVRALIVNSERRPTPVKALHRVISAETAAKMTSILEAVVEEGTAKAARIPGYTIAGKTGTARKVAEGRRGYSNEYNASFVGFAPSRDPVFSIIVVIDSPHGKGYYGGAVAAPIFKRIAEAALRHQGVAPNVDPSRVDRALVARAGGGHAAVTAQVAPTPARASADVSLEEVPPGSMPDLRNSSARSALRRLTRLGLDVRLAGSGVVVGQNIPPGTPIEPGMTCALVLESRPRPVPAGTLP
jgi:cell division protein FtsI/penicillin-binding protein 2